MVIIESMDPRNHTAQQGEIRVTPCISKTYVFGFILAAGILYPFSRSNYLLFHSLIEHACVIVFMSMFLLVWNARDYLRSGFLLQIGLASLPVAIMDWTHSMAFHGMNVFGPVGRNLATSLWVQARFIQATSILLAVIFHSVHSRSIRPGSYLLFWMALGALFMGLSFCGVFPVCFDERSGLTPFKIGAELFICGEFLAALVILRKNRSAFDPELLACETAFLAAALLSEVSFCLYFDVYGFFNAVGHIFKATACFLLYRAIVTIGLRRPYALLFREIKVREEALQKTLEGILPICSGCKKIRDDEGQWKPVETYIQSRTNAEFTHGICPDCMDRLYPGLGKRD